MLDTPHILHTQAVPAAVIRLTIPREQIRHMMGPAVQELMSTVAAQGIAPAGPMFSHHFRHDPEMFDFEVGVPIATPVVAAGRVVPGELPARRVVRALYQGGYEGLGEAWGELGTRIESQGLQAGNEFWERYLSGPESGDDPTGWQTELNRVLAG